MKFTISQQALSTGINIASRAISARSTLPILANILIEVDEDGKLLFEATDLEIGLSHVATAITVESAGKVTVPGKIFKDFVDTLSKDSMVSLTLTERTQTLGIVANKSKINIKCIDADEFPVFRDTKGEGSNFVITGQQLKSVVQQIGFAVSKDESRIVLTGIHAKFKKDKIVFSAADGFIHFPSPLLISPVRISSLFSCHGIYIL